MAAERDQDWDVSSPPDHTLGADVMDEVRGLKSSAKTIIAKEHVSPSTSNSGGQHAKGSARVYLDSAYPTTDPEGSNLGTDDGASTDVDSGRLAVATGVGTNTLRVYMATSEGVSTGWSDLRVAHAGTSARVELENAVPIVGQRVSEPATTMNLVELNSTNVVEIGIAATAVLMTSISSGITADGHVVNKKYLDDKIPDYAGAESVLLKDLVVKHGKTATPTGDLGSGNKVLAVDFNTAFENAVVSVSVTPCHADTTSHIGIHHGVYDPATGGFTIVYSEASAGTQNMDGFEWEAKGY